jgi:hypothetical protein
LEKGERTLMVRDIISIRMNDRTVYSRSERCDRSMPMYLRSPPPARGWLVGWLYWLLGGDDERARTGAGGGIGDVEPKITRPPTRHKKC